METECKEYVKQEHDKVNLLVDTFTLFDDCLLYTSLCVMIVKVTLVKIK